MSTYYRKLLVLFPISISESMISNIREREREREREANKYIII